MCLIIHKPAGTKFDREIVRNASVLNPDGFGFMWIENGIVEAYKSTDMNQIESVLDGFDLHPDIPVGLHLRYATHGSVTNVNCHPFVTKKHRYGLMHNGIVRNVVLSGDESDTRAFCRQIAFPTLQRHDLATASQKIADAHGDGNRMLIAAADGTFVRTGHWTERDGQFYSNGSSFYSYNSLKDWNRIGFGRSDYRMTTDPQELIDFSDWTREQIVRYVKKNPHAVADMILHYNMELDWKDTAYDKF